MRVSTSLLALAGLAMVSTAANADLFQGGSYTTFSGAFSGGPNLNSITNAAAVGGVSTVRFSTDVPAGDQNVLTFTGVNAFDVNAGVDFAIGSLSYFNGTTYTGAQGVTGNRVVPFTSPLGLGTQNFALNYGFTITPNTSDPVASADRLDFTYPASPNFITVDGVNYYLAITGFLLANGTTFTTLNLPERQTVNATVMARFTTEIPTNLVPLPPAVWGGLAGMAGVGGIAAIRRRRIA